MVLIFRGSWERGIGFITFLMIIFVILVFVALMVAWTPELLFPWVREERVPAELNQEKSEASELQIISPSFEYFTELSGLTWDGSHFWIVDISAKVYCVDKSGDLSFSLRLPRYYEPSTAIHEIFSKGLARGESYVWILDESNLIIGGALERSKIVGVDPEGNLTPILLPSQFTKTQLSGIAWDGSNFWIGGFVDGRIYEISDTGGIITSFEWPGRSPSYLAWDGSYLWGIDHYSGVIFKMDRKGGLISSFGPIGITPGGMTWGESRLWVLNEASGKIYGYPPAILEKR